MSIHMPLSADCIFQTGQAPSSSNRLLVKHGRAKYLRLMLSIPRPCDPEVCDNWPGRRQDPWKYIDAELPRSKMEMEVGPPARITSTSKARAEVLALNRSYRETISPKRSRVLAW